jgi:hypothetical protein
VARCQRSKLVWAGREEWIGCHDKCLGALVGESCERPINFGHCGNGVNFDWNSPSIAVEWVRTAFGAVRLTRCGAHPCLRNIMVKRTVGQEKTIKDQIVGTWTFASASKHEKTGTVRCRFFLSATRPAVRHFVGADSASASR